MNSFFINAPVPLSILLFLIWIYLRITKKLKIKSDLVTQPFKNTQFFGMAGIVVFIMPILLLVMLQINKLIPKLIIWIMYKIHIPELIIGIFYLLLYTAALWISFAATYILCEMVWPKRSVNT